MDLLPKARSFSLDTPPAPWDTCSPSSLENAAAASHYEWLTLQARAVGGEVHVRDNLTWTYMPQPEGDSFILFPRLEENQADSLLNEVIQFYRNRCPAKPVGCWSLDPAQPGDLGLRLLSRGFRAGWRPMWMHRNLDGPPIEAPRPTGIRLTPVTDTRGWEADGLPYYSQFQAETLTNARAKAPGHVWSFGAFSGPRPVGHVTLWLSQKHRTVAGLYGLGVCADERGRGIGRALTLAACRRAQDQGYRHVLLNATGERMYRQIGFEHVGLGLTWWLDAHRLPDPQSMEMLVPLAEALGRGDVAAMCQLVPHLDKEQLNTPLANGWTPVEFAVRWEQMGALRWLLERGAKLDVVSAWTLGWRQEAASLLRAEPALANRASGFERQTPLHTAVERSDLTLLRLLLEAGADCTVLDGEYHSTPLGWARHLDRPACADLLEQYEEHYG